MVADTIDDKCATRLVIRPEKDGSGKYPLETFHDAAISLAVFEEMEKIEDLGSCLEPDNGTALADGHSGYPDGEEPILAVRQTVLRMADDLKEEFSITPCVGQLMGWRATEGKTAKDKGPGVEGQFLAASGALLADQANRFELLESPLSDTN